MIKSIMASHPVHNILNIHDYHLIYGRSSHSKLGEENYYFLIDFVGEIN